MLFRLATARVTVGLAGTCFLVGCMAFPGLPSNEPAPPSSRPVAPSRVKPDTYSPTTELRIPGQAVAQASDIPVVPVPPIPLGTGAPARTALPPAMSDIRPVSTLPPVTGRPASANETPVLATPIPASPDYGTPKPKAAKPVAVETYDVKQVIQQANDAYGKLDSYVARLTRREQINGKNKPEELMLFLFRKAPWSVHFKWLGPEGHDREVVYVKGQYEGKIHTLLAAGDIPFMPAGKRMSLAPDSILVKSASRYPINEAGMGASIDRITSLQTALERGDRSRGTLTDRGVQNRPDYKDGSLHLIEHAIPPKAEAEMPRGGKRLYGFDTKSKLPALLVCIDDKGQEVEYYRYDRVMLLHLDDADFNPDKMGAPVVKMAQKP